MKKLNIIALLAMIVLSTSCFKDMSNYNFKEIEKISIRGIESNYEKISMTDSLIITPTVASSIDGSSFEYFWGIYETSVGSGIVQKFDTICKTKNLHYFVTKPATSWTLVFGVKNMKTGYLNISTSILNISTLFTKGWYVLKDDGNKSDLDLFLTPTSIAPISKIENVFSLVNGKKLDGRAINLRFDSRFRVQSGGNIWNLVNMRVLFLVAGNDATVVDINTLKVYSDFNGLFYSAPTIKKPNVIFLAASGKYFINNGLVYSQNSVYAANGKFGNRLMKDSDNKTYNMSPFFFASPSYSPVFFDEISSSFFTTAITATSLNYMTDAPENDLKVNNNNKTLLYMGLKATSPFTGVAILKDKTNGALKILSTLSTPTTTSLKLVNDTLLASSKLYNATRYTCNLIDENMLYFIVNDNEVWSRNLSNKFEQLQYTAPAGETITFISHRAYTTETAYAYNFVIIGTKNGANYTIRMFTKTAGNLAATPTCILTGKGSASDVIFMSPSVIHNTYPSTF